LDDEENEPERDGAFGSAGGEQSGSDKR